MANGARRAAGGKWQEEAPPPRPTETGAKGVCTGRVCDREDRGGGGQRNWPEPSQVQPVTAWPAIGQQEEQEVREGAVGAHRAG